MEAAQFWTWTKRKSSLISSYGDSWEEQAFAEDTAGLLGGCVWPPRSYSCSFCRREFKSAQALGGHMNVHRRDRARLKQQSPIPNNEFLHVSQLVCTLGCNPSSDSDQGFLESPPPSSRVSVPTIRVNCEENTFSQQSRSILVAKRHKDNFNVNKEQKNSNYMKSNYGDGDLSVSLNLVICQTQPTKSNEEFKSVSCKRRRIDATVSFFPEAVLSEDAESEVLEHSPNSEEDMDLELRLGDRPKVK
ncbi:hypothetical protein LguiA_016282 [Lonicera macranthoides]